MAASDVMSAAWILSTIGRTLPAWSAGPAPPEPRYTRSRNTATKLSVAVSALQDHPDRRVAGGVRLLYVLFDGGSVLKSSQNAAIRQSVPILLMFAFFPMGEL